MVHPSAEKSATDNRTIDVRLLQRHPLKVVIGGFCVSVALIILFFVRFYVPYKLEILRGQLHDCEMLKAQAEAKIPVPPEDPDALTLTPAQVHEQFAARKGRDAEQDFFSRNLNGKNIHWDVEVSRKADDNGYLFFRLPEGEGQAGPITMVVFEGATAKRASSLHVGDIIHLDGTLSYTTQDTVTVEKATFSFLRGPESKTSQSH